MAKKTTKAADPASQPQTTTGNIGEQAKARAEKRKTIAQQDVFVFVTKGEKPLAPQAQTIVNTIEAAGEAGVLRPELIQQLGGVLVTRQPAERILNYYQKSLIEAGLIKVVNALRDEQAEA